MNRREFSVGAACVLATAALGLPGALLAQVKKPEEGTEYLTLDKRVGIRCAAGKVEVIEFFWYSCPHCNAFEPKLEAWIKKLPGDVVLKRVPVAFRDDFVPQQRLFYTLEALGKLDELHAKVFQAIHAERLPINREDTSSPGPASRAWTRPSSTSCTTPSPCRARRGAPPSCKRPSRCRACPPWASRGAITPTAPWPAPWTAPAGHRLPDRRSPQGTLAPAAAVT